MEHRKLRERRNLLKLLGAGAAMLPTLFAASKAQAFAPVQCFVRGTSIATATGDKPVEALQPGDLLATPRGELLPVRWVGQRTIRRIAEVWVGPTPIRVSASALGDGRPHRDLYVSPAHAFLIDDVLIAAEHLVNGNSVVAVEPQGDEFDYFHIELATHEVIFAEGALVETLLVTSAASRQGFTNHNEADHVGAVSAMTPFAPNVSYNGGKSELRALTRSVVSRFVDVRDPVQVAFDRIAEQAYREAA